MSSARTLFKHAALAGCSTDHGLNFTDIPQVLRVRFAKY